MAHRQIPPAVTCWLGALLLATTVISLVLWQAREPSRPVLQAGVVLDSPRSLPAFALLDHRGEPFNQASFTGRWTLVFPGFTYCPDICPTNLATLNTVYKLLGENASQLQVVLLTVDPERDTAQVLAAYVGHFNQSFVGVTGKAEQLDILYRSLGVNHIRIPGAKGEYSVDHSAALLLIDPTGRLVGYFMPPFIADNLTQDLAPLVKDRPGWWALADWRKRF